MHKGFIGIWLLLFIAAFSCKSKGTDKVVSFGNEVLYESDIRLLLGTEKFTDLERDEIVVAWIQSRLAASFWDSLPKDFQQKIELRTEEYKAALIAFEWENRWIESRLDTVVSETEMERYYQNNIQDFLLNDFIVRLLYLKIPDMAPDNELLRQLFLLKKPTDTAKITQYANQYASSFYFNKENWISFEDFVKELPVEFLDVERFVTNKTKQVFEENGFMYFINIFDYRLKNTPSPFTYEKERIRSRIILNRKLELRNFAKTFFENKLKQHDEIQYYIP